MDTSRKIEEKMLSLLIGILEKKEGSQEKLEKFINSVWEIRTQLLENICSYNLLHAFHAWMTIDKNNVRLVDADRDISIGLAERTITILNHQKEKEIVIQIDTQLSDELYDFIVRIGQESNRLDVNELTENYNTSDVDLSGI